MLRIFYILFVFCLLEIAVVRVSLLWVAIAQSKAPNSSIISLVIAL
ncbi:MAG: hypothetical protein ABG776_06580 [Cyanobacteria bacterium J06555_13]